MLAEKRVAVHLFVLMMTISFKITSIHANREVIHIFPDNYNEDDENQMTGVDFFDTESSNAAMDDVTINAKEIVHVAPHNDNQQQQQLVRDDKNKIDNLNHNQIRFRLRRKPYEEEVMDDVEDDHQLAGDFFDTEFPDFAMDVTNANDLLHIGDDSEEQLASDFFYEALNNKVNIDNHNHNGGGLRRKLDDDEMDEMELFDFYHRTLGDMMDSMKHDKCRKRPIIKLVLWDLDNDVPIHGLFPADTIFLCEYGNTQLAIKAVILKEARECVDKVDFKLFRNGKPGRELTSMKPLPPLPLNRQGGYVLDVKPKAISPPPQFPKQTFVLAVLGSYPKCGQNQYIFEPIDEED